MEIYGVLLSAYVARIVIAARAKGLKYKLVAPKDGFKTPAFLKINPFGKIPAIKDGGFALYESSVILEYLDSKYKAKRLIPADPKAAARVRLLGAVVSEYVQPAAYGLFAFRDPATRDNKALGEKLAALDKALDIVEKMVAAKPFAAGAKLSLADCYLLPTLFTLTFLMPTFRGGNPLGGRKKLNLYMSKAAKDKVLGGVFKDLNEALKAYMATMAAK